ncbi:MAG: oligosaccharide flippase family protein, partial [Microcoleus sp. SIO2G3]|nr:oligosaccharide flippase family protein [Microcoleus sp. SIO2G3]
LTQQRMEHRFRLRIDRQARSEVLAFCAGGVGNSLGYYFNYNSDNFVIGKLLGSASLGFYNLAYQLTNTLTNILAQALGDLGMASFAQIADDRQQEKTLVQVVEHTAFLAAPVYVILSLMLDPQVVAIVFGSHWVPICAVIPWLMFYAYTRLVNLAMIAVLNAKGRPQITAKVNLAIAPIAAFAFFFVAPRGNILGVSVVVALLLGIVWTLLTWWAGCHALKWSIGKFLLACFKPVGFALLAGSLAVMLPTLLKPIAFLAVYLLLVRLLAAAQFCEYQALFRRFTQRLSVYRP